MKKYNLYILTLAGLMVLFNACKDEDLVILPEWESGVHAYTIVADGSASDFKDQETDIPITFNMKWKSIDRENTVNKIELFVLFNEPYIDLDGNPKTAAHGGDEGVLWATLEGGDVPANAEFTSFTITQDEVYQLYSGATYDYENGNGEVPVYANPDAPERDADTRPFIPGDTFSMRWVLYTDDGRMFDSWSPSVCTEFPEANCSINWSIVCADAIANPPGDYTIVFNDSYGDGWNGGAIRVVVDGTPTDYTLEDGSTQTLVITVPDGTSTLTFEYVSGDWDSEVTFTITSPKGNVISSAGPSPAAGELTLDLCLE